MRTLFGRASFISFLIITSILATRAVAANPMGYRLLAQDEALSLVHSGGALGMDVERAQRINDDGLGFDIIRVKQVHRGSAGERAGFRTGDQIIAVDGRVFASLTSFSAYVGSKSPGSQIAVDYMPAFGGPKQAQRVNAVVGAAGQKMPAADPGMSTRTKVAIGVGAAALFGCYEMGCFSHHQGAPYPKAQTPSNPKQPYSPQTNAYPQQ